MHLPGGVSGQYLPRMDNESAQSKNTERVQREFTVFHETRADDRFLVRATKRRILVLFRNFRFASCSDEELRKSCKLDAGLTFHLSFAKNTSRLNKKCPPICPGAAKKNATLTKGCAVSFCGGVHRPGSSLLKRRPTESVVRCDV